MEINFDFINELIKVVKNAYEQTRKMNNINIKNKEKKDIVTDIDIYMEKQIIYFIKQKFPNHSIFSEEVGDDGNKSSEYQWLIDPIDGTINFATEIPLFATSIALRKNYDTIFGIIFDYSQNDIYYCIKKQGAYCNGKPIKVSNNNQLKNSVISFCLTSHYNETHIKEILNIEEKLASRVRGLRLIVSAAIELAWCASGKIDGCINIKPSVGLSSAAGKLLVKEAGGKVTNIEGKQRKNIDTMLVTNGKIHNEILSVIKEK